MKKCSDCKYFKTYMDKKDLVDRIYTMVCTKSFPNITILDIQTGQPDENEINNMECIKHTDD